MHTKVYIYIVYAYWNILQKPYKLQQENNNSVVLRYKPFDKSLAVYRKIYVQSVVYYTNPTWGRIFTVAIITALLMENWNDKTIITDQFTLVYRDSKLILHVCFFHVFFLFQKERLI
jgi:hypothetical protein